MLFTAYRLYAAVGPKGTAKDAVGLDRKKETILPYVPPPEVSGKDAFVQQMIRVRRQVRLICADRHRHT
jgi:hypothetical protein